MSAIALEMEESQSVVVPLKTNVVIRCVTSQQQSTKVFYILFSTPLSSTFRSLLKINTSSQSESLQSPHHMSHHISVRAWSPRRRE